MPRPILAIDPGTTATGIAVFDAAGTLVHSAHRPHTAALPGDTVRRWLAELPGLSVVCESQYAPQRSGKMSESEAKKVAAQAQSALVVAAIRGQWQAAASLAKCPCYVVHPSRWRALLNFGAGSRAAQKAKAIELATKRWNITQPDAAEAACIGFAACYVRDLCDLKPPKKSAPTLKKKAPKNCEWT
jgi:Holliday junction resolvasome RuvABC endonuclease subunit